MIEAAAALQHNRAVAAATQSVSSTPRFNFARVVENAKLQGQNSKPKNAFRAAAFSVLSPANRKFIESQKAEAERRPQVWSRDGMS